MKLYLDSANVSEARMVKEWGWVSGVTTNPILMSQVNEDVASTLRQLAAVGFNELFYQVVSQDLEGMISEARLVKEIVGKSLILKVPPNDLGFRFVVNNKSDYPCCVTAIYNPSQALVARAAGAKYLAVYVNRASRLLGDGIGLVSEITKILIGCDTELIAASIKSPAEACAAFSAGAHHITLSMAVLEKLSEDNNSIETMKQFNLTGKGLEKSQK